MPCSRMQGFPCSGSELPGSAASRPTWFRARYLTSSWFSHHNPQGDACSPQRCLNLHSWMHCTAGWGMGMRLPPLGQPCTCQPCCWQTLLSGEGLETWPSGAGWGKTALLIQCLETSSFLTSHFQEQVHCSALQTVITGGNLS